MLESILNREDIKSFLAETITQIKYNDKEIPNTFCEEKITKEQYSLYIVVDAIIKYFVIVGLDNIDLYIEQLKKIMKKLQTHRDITCAVNRLLIKSVKEKLDIKEESEQSKEQIANYFYNQYIKEGYLFHSFPSHFYQENKELDIKNYYYKYDEMKEISKILTKYKIDNNFSKNFNLDKARISFTDSSFMAAFYSYNCPLFLYELCDKLIRKNSKKDIISNDYFYKNYSECFNQLDKFLRKKQVLATDKNKILNFFKNEWKSLNVTKGEPIIGFIKRKDLKLDFLDNYSIMINKEDTLEYIVSKILDSRLNDNKVYENIKPEFYLRLPSIYEILNKVENESEIKSEEEVTDLNNNDGNATVIALLGVLLIALGVTLTIIMIGR